MHKIAKGINGNATITIYSDGTRIVHYPSTEKLSLEYPLNVDIRLSNKCKFGLKPDGTSVCDFCHESAKTDGVTGDLKALFIKLSKLPLTTEIAIGINHFENNVIEHLLVPLKNSGYIVNITINQGMLFTYANKIKYLIDNNIIQGLGISYRKGMKNIPDFILDYPNTVLHCIIGIDSLEDLLSNNVPNIKLLLLGEKDFGANFGKVNLNSDTHKDWRINYKNLFKKFKIVSFDNLALAQLSVSSDLTKKEWDLFYQAEHSFYIDAANETFALSSRSDEKTDWNLYSISQYYLNKVA